jgi:hypothetical protein
MPQAKTKARQRGRKWYLCVLFIVD